MTSYQPINKLRSFLLLSNDEKTVDLIISSFKEFLEEFSDKNVKQVINVVNEKLDYSCVKHLTQQEKDILMIGYDAFMNEMKEVQFNDNNHKYMNVPENELTDVLKYEPPTREALLGMYKFFKVLLPENTKYSVGIKYDPECGYADILFHMSNTGLTRQEIWTLKEQHVFGNEELNRLETLHLEHNSFDVRWMLY